MDRVILKELEVEAKVGILDWERVQSQRLLVSCELEVCTKAAAEKDEIELTIDYAKVRDVIHSYSNNHRVGLLETWAQQLADRLFENFLIVKQLSLCVFKPSIFQDAGAVGVSIERCRAKQ